MSSGTFQIATVEPGDPGKPLSIDHLYRMASLAQDVPAAQPLNYPIHVHDGKRCGVGEINLG